MNATPAPAGSYQKILFCTDFSAGADRAFAHLLGFTQNPGCQLILLHVIPETDAQFWKSYIYEVDHVDEQARHAIHAKIKETYLAKLAPGFPVKVELRIGQMAEKALELAAEREVDLIVLGRAAGGRLAQALAGHDVDKILHKAACPVLVVPGLGPTS